MLCQITQHKNWFAYKSYLNTVIIVCFELAYIVELFLVLIENLKMVCLSELNLLILILNAYEHSRFYGKKPRNCRASAVR